jgi:NitT/TauT family transport system ATP-binding protein
VRPPTEEEQAARFASDPVIPTGPGASARTVVSIADVTKSFGTGSQRVVALDGVTLDVERGDFVCLLGASGCGKSTLLNLIAGLDKPTSGRVDVRAERTGLMFQEAALFPWLDVTGNVMFGLKLKPGLKNKERLEVAKFFLQLVGLEKFSAAHVHELSGGMKQRVALARVLAFDPKVLLMDEPFGALDAQTRETMQEEVIRLWERTRKTIVFVTHDIEEAVFLGDRVVVLTARPGRIREEVKIDLPRPRDLTVKKSIQCHEYRNYVWDMIRSESRAA